MRLIDADALLENKFEFIDYGDPIEVVEVSDIDDAPTIKAEPVRCGKWRIIHDSYDKAKEYNCSSCDANHIREYNFCPSCGAKMEGNQNGTARKYDTETFRKD